MLLNSNNNVLASVSCDNNNITYHNCSSCGGSVGNQYGVNCSGACLFSTRAVNNVYGTDKCGKCFGHSDIPCNNYSDCTSFNFCLSGITCGVNTYINGGSCSNCPMGCNTNGATMQTSCNYAYAGYYKAGNNNCPACNGSTHYTTSTNQSSSCTAKNVRNCSGYVNSTTSQQCSLCTGGWSLKGSGTSSYCIKIQIIVAVGTAHLLQLITFVMDVMQIGVL